MATNQIERFGEKLVVWERTTQGTFLINLCQNICNEVEIMLNFPILSLKKVCLSNKKYLCKGKKKKKKKKKKKIEQVPGGARIPQPVPFLNL